MVAARLNGYLVGVGQETEFEKDMVKLGLSEKMIEFVRKRYQENKGGNLYC